MLTFLVSIFPGIILAGRDFVLSGFFRPSNIEEPLTGKDALGAFT